MNYIEQSLAKDEQVIARIKHSWAGLVSIAIGFLILFAFAIVFLCIIPIATAIGDRFFPDEPIKMEPQTLTYCILCMFIGAILLLFAIVFLVRNIAEIKCAQLVVTNKRLLGRRGFISKSTTDILLSKVDTINAANGFFGAIFHYGSIQIVSAGSNANNRRANANMTYCYISNTMEFRKAVLDAIEQVKEDERAAQIAAINQAVNR